MAASRIRTAPSGETIQKGGGTLVAGTLDVLARVQAGSTVFATIDTEAGADGLLSIPASTTTQFTVTSSDLAATSSFDWVVFPPDFRGMPSGQFESSVNNLGVEIFTGVATLNGVTGVVVDLGALNFPGALTATSRIIVTFVTLVGGILVHQMVSAPVADRDVGAQTFEVVGSAAEIGASTVNWMIVNDAHAGQSGEPLPAGQVTLVAGTAAVPAEDYAAAGPGGMLVMNVVNPASNLPTRGEITSVTAATIATPDAGDTQAVDFLVIQ